MAVSSTVSNDEEDEKPRLPTPLFALIPATLSKSLTSEKMMDFLRNQDAYECRLAIFHPIVVQRSYGKERRYFSPPACVYLIGQGWKLKKQRVLDLYKSLKLNGNSDHEERPAEIVAYIDTGTKDGEQLLLDFSAGKNYCVAKELSINDLDTRKHFDLNINFFYGCGIEIGNFVSLKIKTISKPTINRSRYSDFKYSGIASGTKVALIYRNQAHVHRYLHVEEEEYSVSETKWGNFTIYLCEDSSEHGPQDNKKFVAKEGYIYYGNVVKLVDFNTGISLPLMKIRRLANHRVILDSADNEESAEPVCRMNKCAFQMVENDKMYISRSEDTIVQHEAKVMSDTIHLIDEGATWTIISTDVVEYRFYEAMGFVSTPISPCPVVMSVEVFGSGENEWAEVFGRDFKPDLKIWFGATEVETMFYNEEKLVCKIPKKEKVVNNETISIFKKTRIGVPEIPISLVRDDGVIYPTNHTFSYKSLESLGTLDSKEPPRKTAKISNDDDKMLLELL